MKNLVQQHGCSPKPAIADRDQLSPELASRLTRFFKIFANDGRLQLLHALLRSGEESVSELASEIGMSTQAVSNQLQNLSAEGIVQSRRDGNNIFYTIKDPCVPSLFELAWCLIEELPSE